MVTDRADQRCRREADKHYSRQTPGATQFVRPGWTQVLWASDGHGVAVWVWWRPKWESGILGTERKDGLRCVENVLFRNGTRWLSSELIREAVAAGLTWEHALDVELPDVWITGINSGATAARRSRNSLPGKCYREAGWIEMPGKTTARADVWLRCGAFSAPERPACVRRGQTDLWSGA